jgi:lipopolysaccharide export system permease protein
MKKLDWYILKKFLSTFFFAIFLFVVIAVVIDISEKADDFVKSQLGVKKIFTDYYLGFIPHITALLFPLFVFIAVIFFTSKMAGRSEIIAILASGTSFNRWLRPYFVGGVLLAALLFYANHYVVPNANKVRGAFEAKYIDANSSYEALNNRNRSNDIYLKVDSNTYAGIVNYDTASKSGGPFFMHKLRGTILIQNMRADMIRWDTAHKKWLLTYIVKRDISGMKETISMSAADNLNFDFKPVDLNRDKYTKDKLVSSELDKHIQLERMRGSEGLNELLVERGRRDATPVTVLLLTIIGAVVAGRKVRGGSGAHLAWGFLTAALFIVADKFSTIFSTKGNLPPGIAVWIPNIIFFFVAIAFYRKAPK